MWARLGVWLVAALILTMSSRDGAAQRYEQELERVATSLSASLQKAGIKNVAVVDFTDLQGNVTELGRFLAEELSTYLVNAAKDFSVVDRNNFRFILREQKITMEGLVDPSSTKKLGQISGVDGLVTGKITPLGESIRLTMSVLSTESAKVIAATPATITASGPLQALSGTVVAAQELTRPGTFAPAEQPAAPKPKAAELPEFKNNFMTVRVTRVTTGSKSGTAVISIDILSTAKEKFYAALVTDEYRKNREGSEVKVPTKFLVDHEGKQWMLQRPAIGMGTTRVGELECENVTRIDPGQQQRVSFEFSPPERSGAKTADLTFKMVTNNNCGRFHSGDLFTIVTLPGINIR